MKNSTLILTLLLMVSVPLTGAGRNQNWDNGLNLTNEQMQAHSALRDQFQKENIRIRSEIKILRLELHAMMKSATPDKNAIDVTLGKISAMESDLEKRRVENRMAMRAMLTEDQKTVFDSRSMGNGRRYGRGAQGGFGDQGDCTGDGAGRNRGGKRQGRGI